ncbi:hypothetical protein V1291_004580 [Nitrobacteraceae bacterium AZCC 1564]
MTVQPLVPWVRWTRTGVIGIGLGWVPCLFLWHRFIEHSEVIRAGLIVALFAWSMIFPWLLLLSLLLPTHKLRIVGMPVVFLVWYLTATSPQPFGNLTPESAPWLALWLTTCVAVTLLVPQFTTIAAFVIFVAKDLRKRWMRR